MSPHGSIGLLPICCTSPFSLLYVVDTDVRWFYRISWFLAVIVNILPHVVTWFVSVIWGTITESFKTKMGLFEALKGFFKPILYAARYVRRASRMLWGERLIA